MEAWGKEGGKDDSADEEGDAAIAGAAGTARAESPAGAPACPRAAAAALAAAPAADTAEDVCPTILTTTGGPDGAARNCCSCTALAASSRDLGLVPWAASARSPWLQPALVAAREASICTRRNWAALAAMAAGAVGAGLRAREGFADSAKECSTTGTALNSIAAFAAAVAAAWACLSSTVL